jgi:hypothetical protein
MDVFGLFIDFRRQMRYNKISNVQKKGESLMAKKVDYKMLSADEIRRKYHCVVLLLWICHLLTIVLAGALIGFLIAGRLSIVDFTFAAVAVIGGNYLLRQLRRVKFAGLAEVLTQACDPVKLLAVLEKLRQPWALNPDRMLLTARCQYYKGDVQQAMSLLRDMPQPKEEKKPTLWTFQYYNLWISCYETLGDVDRVIETREKAKKLMTNLKPNSAQMRNAQQLLTIIDGVTAFFRQNYQKCWDITEEMYETSSFALTRIYASLRMARIEQMRGAGRSAIERCEYVIDDGGTTFFVHEAKELLAICGSRRQTPISEEPEEEEED